MSLVEPCSKFASRSARTKVEMRKLVDGGRVPVICEDLGTSVRVLHREIVLDGLNIEGNLLPSA